jgi:hypothetical protein
VHVIQTPWQLIGGLILERTFDFLSESIFSDLTT